MSQLPRRPLAVSRTGCWDVGETKHRPFLQGEEHHCPNPPQQEPGSRRRAPARRWAPGRHKNTIHRSNESGKDTSDPKR